MNFYFCAALPVELVGLGFLWAAGRLRRGQKRRREQASVQAEARIVERRVETGSGGRHRVYCVYEYLAEGVPRRAEYTGLRRARVGDMVRIFYDPRRPEEICIPELQPWAGVAALYFIGGAWALMGAVMPVLGFLGVA